MIRKDLHEANRAAWNRATDAHNSHKADQARFFRDGGETVFPEELELLGELSGRRLLHLQCNAGQDTLSLVRRGAIATGVDISDTAIDFARQLSADAGLPATFVRADVYDWLAATAGREEPFEVVFSSYGALCWLSNLGAWARGIAAVLQPGGRFVLVEFHPYFVILEEGWRLGDYPYSSEGQPISIDEGIGDYVAMSGTALAPSGYLPGVQDFKNPHPGHEFAWGVADVIGALLAAGLTLKTLREYPYANGDRFFPDMRALPGQRWAPPEGVSNIPLMFGVVAVKEAP
jgi:SAM-dependent methyltransferase